MTIAAWLLWCLLGAAQNSIEPMVAEHNTGQLHWIYRGYLTNGWQDRGWISRDINLGKPARLDFSQAGGWMISQTELLGSFTALHFEITTNPNWGNFLSVNLANDSEDIFPRVLLNSTRSAWIPGTQTLRVHLSMQRLNPNNLYFNRIVFSADPGAAIFKQNVTVSSNDAVEKIQVALDNIYLVGGDKSANKALIAAEPTMPMVQIDCQRARLPISPLIYGIGYNPQPTLPDDSWAMQPSARRFGGNASSRYNYRLGNAWNAGQDWFFLNTDYGQSPKLVWDQFIRDNTAHSARSALTLPLLGWVAKDTNSYTFSVKAFGAQRRIHPANRDIGNGETLQGKLLVNSQPRTTSIPAPPAFVAAWASEVRASLADRPGNMLYFLDSKPSLWHITHRDVHPLPIGYEELWQRTWQYGTAVRSAHPEAIIAGPSDWGWPTLFYSPIDGIQGYSHRPDRLAHGDTPLLAWYLQKLAQHQRREHQVLVDVIDTHFYPQAAYVFGEDEKTDAATAALRIRSTRALWDSTYKDESWINDYMALIPRLKAMVAQYYPGRRIGIGEYNFGGEHHISGSLAVAEALGRFGQMGVYSAFYWLMPPVGSAVANAFMAYRNYDGNGAMFPEIAVQVDFPSKSALSVFAATNASTNKLVLVLLNLNPNQTIDPSFSLRQCGDIVGGRHFHYTSKIERLLPDPTPLGMQGLTKLHERLAPYSLNVLELQLDPSTAAATTAERLPRD